MKVNDVIYYTILLFYYTVNLFVLLNMIFYDFLFITIYLL